MVYGDTSGFTGVDECGCCHLSEYEKDGAFVCSDRSKIFTLREQAVLSRIRDAGKEARGLKDRIRRLEMGGGGNGGEREKAVEELGNLRKMRAELEKERVAAAEERMRLLGHA